MDGKQGSPKGNPARIDVVVIGPPHKFLMAMKETRVNKRPSRGDLIHVGEKTLTVYSVDSRPDRINIECSPVPAYDDEKYEAYKSALTEDDWYVELRGE